MVYHCSACGKSFKATTALEQHQWATDHWEEEEEEHSCDVCGKVFWAEGSLAQHKHSTGHYGESEDEFADEYEVPLPEPPVDSPGEWVLREDFTGRKSFGFFICDCGRFWTTAHAQKEYRQGCQGCEKESYAYYMWQNHGVSTRRRNEDEEESAPHDSPRCEACRRGVCDRAVLPF